MELSALKGEPPKRRYKTETKARRCSKCQEERSTKTGHVFYKMQGGRGGNHTFCPTKDGDLAEWKVKMDKIDMAKKKLV